MIEKIATDSTSLLIHQSKYLDNIEEVAYKIRDNYIISNCYKLIKLEHYKHRLSGSFDLNPTDVGFDYWAYGLLVSLFRTRLLPIDIDEIITPAIYNRLLERLSMMRTVDGIDLIESSGNRYHLYIGLNQHANVSKLIRTLPCPMCNKYVNTFLQKGAQIIRVSSKFVSTENRRCFNGNHRRPIESVRFNKNREAIIYNAPRILPPITSSKTTLPSARTKKNIKLRK